MPCGEFSSFYIVIDISITHNCTDVFFVNKIIVS